MKNNSQSLSKKIKGFIKRNSYSLLVVGCAFFLALSLGITAIVRANNAKKEVPIDDPQSEVVSTNPPESQATASEQIVFEFPLKNYTLGHTYSETKLVKNETLGEWTTHLGVDFVATDDTNVYACYAGVIKSIDYDNLTGTVITIEHADGLTTVYSSLGSDVAVKVGQTVNKGDVIGTASNSSMSESKLGNHIHLETYKDGNPVNPMTYLGEK